MNQDLGCVNGGSGIGCELEPAGGDRLLHQALQARLVDRAIALLQARELGGIHIHADYLHAGCRETGSGDQAHIAAAENCDRHGGLRCVCSLHDGKKDGNAKAMSREAFERGDWQAVIEAHPLESHDPEEWLRYSVALLQTLTTGPDAGKQQQQAALAFVQAQREGASAEQVAEAQRRSALISLEEALTIAGVKQCRQRKPSGGPVALLHLHGFKCAGSRFIWSLERATGGQLAYVEADQPNRRLPWQRLQKHLQTLKQQPLAITSHLVSLPPEAELAALKVAFLRQPLARLLSAYRFQAEVQNKHQGLSFEDYLRRHSRGALSNYQTRHLSPQQKEDWQDRRGWGARPELIDLERPDLFVGLVERYDESVVALEYALEQQGVSFDLAYPQAMNTTRSQPELENVAEQLPPQLLLEATELDERLYRRAAARLDARINTIAGFDARLQDFRQRCESLASAPAGIRVRPPQEWTRLPVAVS